jgi:hypothetical protein
MHNVRLRGQVDDLLFLPDGERKIGSLKNALLDEDPVPGVMVLGTGKLGTGKLGQVVGENEGSFYAETGSVPTTVATDSFRVTQMRVGYECVSGSGVTVQTGDAETAEWNPHVAETTLPSTDYIVTTAKVRAQTSTSSNAAIGQQGRQFSVRVAEDSAEHPTRLAVHELQVVAREYDQRD